MEHQSGAFKDEVQDHLRRAGQNLVKVGVPAHKII
jgi:hypothetical protein